MPFGEYWLIDLVEAQTEVIAVDGLRVVKFITSCRPVADQVGPSCGADTVNQANGVDKFIEAFFLVAEPEDRHHLAGEIGCLQLRQFTFIKCRTAEYQPVAGNKIGQRRAADIDRRVRSACSGFRTRFSGNVRKSVRCDVC